MKLITRRIRLLENRVASHEIGRPSPVEVLRERRRRRLEANGLPYVERGREPLVPDVCRGATGCACPAPRRIAAYGKGGTGAMTAVTRRIAKLENQLGTSEGTQGILYLVCHAGTTQADMDPDIQILSESGFLPPAPAFAFLPECSCSTAFPPP